MNGMTRKKVSVGTPNGEAALIKSGTTVNYMGRNILCARSGQFILRYGRSHKSFDTLQAAKDFIDNFAKQGSWS